MVWFLAFTFMAVPGVQAYAASRIIPSGKVNVFLDGRLVRVLSEEAPLATGVMLNPQGDCGVRMNNFFLVAKDGSMFSVPDAGSAHVKINDGLIFFAVNRHTGQVVFETPSGVVDTQQILIHAGEGDAAMLKGYVDVTGGTTRVGVLEGGSMVVSTPEGIKEIQPGTQIVLAQAGLIKPAPPAGADAAAPAAPQPAEPEEQDDRKVPAVYYKVGAAILGVGVLAALLAGGGGGGGDSSQPSSPSAP
jgi:hypothetical protein